MTSQEARLLHELLEQLVQVRGIDKDPQADALIERAVARQPDAAYLLVQRVLLQDQALAAAKARIADLESRVVADVPATRSFLGTADVWGNSARLAPLSAAGSPLSEPARYQPPPQAAAPRFFGGSGGSFLGSMAATAAGVAGGAFLFQGIERLLGHQGGPDSPLQHGAAALGADDYPGTDQSASGLIADSPLADDAGINDIDFGNGDELGA